MLFFLMIFEKSLDRDGSICYLIGVRKEIRSRIGKQPGDQVFVTVQKRD